MTDAEWAIRLVENVAACASNGDGVKRFALLEQARGEANGSDVRRMAITTLEACMPKLDGEVTARKHVEAMFERIGAARVVFNGPVTQGAGSTIGEDNSTDKSISENANGRKGPERK